MILGADTGATITVDGGTMALMAATEVAAHAPSETDAGLRRCRTRLAARLTYFQPVSEKVLPSIGAGIACCGIDRFVVDNLP